jgi:hypothetical protein
VPFAPIQSPALLNASRLLDNVDREHGRVIHDVTELIMPKLNRIPFGDGSRWPASFRLSVSPTSRSAGSIELPKFAGRLQREHARADVARKRSIQHLCRRVDAVSGAKTIHQALWAAATRAMTEMRETNRDMADIFDDSFAVWYAKDWNESNNHAVRTASNILSVYDLCFDPETKALDIAALPATERYGEDAYASVTLVRVEAPQMGFRAAPQACKMSQPSSSLSSFS